MATENFRSRERSGVSLDYPGSRYRPYHIAWALALLVKNKAEQQLPSRKVTLSWVVRICCVSRLTCFSLLAGDWCQTPGTKNKVLLLYLCSPVHIHPLGHGS